MSDPTTIPATVAPGIVREGRAGLSPDDAARAVVVAALAGGARE